MVGKIYAAILISFLGALSLIIGIVILIRGGYFSYSKGGQFIGKVAGKKAKSEAIWRIIAGLVFLGLATALYFWGG
jgi:hypothetical protein